ncbi:MAG: endolytic transglycosylase MltG [Lachnospiraceae bacterium]|nr:endolytic transglycosylase MltG [Lachnospiraceae bacterium]
MKLKYFIRGLGIGIIFGTLIMLVAHFKSDENNLTDSQVEARASELGMVWPEEATATDTIENINSEKKNDTSDISTEVVTEVRHTEAEITTESVTETTEEEENTVEATTEATVTQATTEEKKTTEKNTYTEATITVTRGMGSTQVAELLENAGIIEDAEDFDNYLNSHGISNKIQINTFKFNSNMSYEELAEGLTTPKNE